MATVAVGVCFRSASAMGRGRPAVGEVRAAASDRDITSRIRRLHMKLHMKRSIASLCLGAAAVASFASPSQASDYCASGKTVTFAGITWESGAFITEVMKAILAKGYGCKVDSITGNTVTLEQALANNDIQIFAEEWIGRSDAWNKAAADGKVKAVGHTFKGATEGWYVPDYVVNGDAAKGVAPLAPRLKKVEDLKDPKYVALFRDAEEPAKGRFLNCPSGWTCEGVNTAKIEAYGLDESYVNFRPGTGTALDAAIVSAYKQREPILFYYWSPTAIMGKFKLVKLEEPPYNDACWATLTSRDAKTRQGCSSPSATVQYGVSSAFANAAPELIAVLEKATFPLDEINASLATMADEKAEASEVATEFLKTKEAVWGPWVSHQVRAKIKAALK
jgi:glycine betaine/proline transport system substrate-binding protein